MADTCIIRVYFIFLFPALLISGRTLTDKYRAVKRANLFISCILHDQFSKKGMRSQQVARCRESSTFSADTFYSVTN